MKSTEKVEVIEKQAISENEEEEEGEEEAGDEIEYEEESSDGAADDSDYSVVDEEEVKTETKVREMPSGSSSVLPEFQRHSSSFKEPVELEEIVKIFAHDLQQSIRQRFKSKQQYTKDAEKGVSS